MISISKAEHLPSFWNRGPGELGNGLVSWQANLELVIGLVRNVPGLDEDEIMSTCMRHEFHIFEPRNEEIN